MIARRPLAAAVAGLSGVALAQIAMAGVARADFISAPDVVVYCDPALVQSLGGVGADFRARAGVPVRVLSAPGTLLLELLARGTRNDVLVTLADLMEAAARRTLIRPETRAGAWRDPVVLAARDAAAGLAPIGVQSLQALLGDGRLAVVDPVAADRMDGAAILDRLGWTSAVAGRVDGMASGQEVAFGVASGADRLGLLYRSDLAGHRTLSMVGTLPGDAAPPAEYAAAISHNVLSRNAAAFLAYLNGPEATGRLRGDGLEKIG